MFNWIFEIFNWSSSFQFNSGLTEETNKEYSDPEEVPIRYRSNSLPQSRRGSFDMPEVTHQPIVRRVGSRQMLVLGDEHFSSIHGKIESYHFYMYRVKWKLKQQKWRCLNHTPAFYNMHSSISKTNLYHLQVEFPRFKVGLFGCSTILLLRTTASVIRINF